MIMEVEKYLPWWNRENFPWPDEVLVDDHSAVMSRRAFDRAPEYSCTYPSGVYPGKRWKAQCPTTRRWFLCEYVTCEKPDHCGHHNRLIYIVENN